MKLYSWNIPEISHFLKYDRYMSWIFHTHDTIQIPDVCAAVCLESAHFFSSKLFRRLCCACLCIQRTPAACHLHRKLESRLLGSSEYRIAQDPADSDPATNLARKGFQRDRDIHQQSGRCIFCILEMTFAYFAYRAHYVAYFAHCMQYWAISWKPAYCLHILHLILHIFLHILHTDLNCIFCIFYILVYIFCILFHILFDIFCILISIAYFAYCAY